MCRLVTPPMRSLRMLFALRQLHPTLCTRARCVGRVGDVLYLYAQCRQSGLGQTQVAQSTGHKMLETKAGTWRQLVWILAGGLLRDGSACGSGELGWRELVGRAPSSSVVFRAGVPGVPGVPSVYAPQACRCSRRWLADDVRTQTVMGLGWAAVVVVVMMVMVVVLGSIVQEEPILGSGRRCRYGCRCWRRRGAGVCAFHDVDLRATSNRSSVAALLACPRAVVVVVVDASLVDCREVGSAASVTR